MNFSEFTESIQAHPLIKELKLDVKIVPIAYKNYRNQRFANGKKFFVAAINIANNNKARKDAKGILRVIFNDQSIEAERLRSQGCNFVCTDYQGDKKRKSINFATRKVVENSLKKHKEYVTKTEEICFEKELKMEVAIKYEDNKITLQQVFTTMRSDQSILVPVFTQLHWCTNEQSWVGICKKSNFKLATMLSESKILARLMITRFGKLAEAWFPNSLLNLAAKLKFDENTKELIGKLTYEFAPLTHMQTSNINDEQLMALFGHGDTS